MPEFNLDQYKKTWQEQPVEHKYSNAEILKMLNKNSRNYVKYILWISVIEFVFFLSLTIYYILVNDNNSSYLKIFAKLGIENTTEVVRDLDHLNFIIKVITLLITFIFVLIFLRNYQKIKVESNLKKFILQIVKFKKTVNLFIFTNICLLIVTTFALTYFVYYTLQRQNIELPKDTASGLIVGVIVTTILCVVLFLVYYRIVYGIIMRRLGVHLKQLKEIEETE